MNATAAYKDELQKLLEDLSSDRLVLGITFVALVDAYIIRLDTNCPDISARVNPLAAQIDGELTYGANIDSKLRAVLRATQNSKTARRVFPKISRYCSQASAGYSFAAAARRTFPAATAFPGQWPLTDLGQRVNPNIELPKSVANTELEPRKQKKQRPR
jgi:hypothetical protein